MKLILEVAPETKKRVERATSQGANMDALLCIALEHWSRTTEPESSGAARSVASLAGKYEGESWHELMTEIERNRQQDSEPVAEGR